MTADAGAAAAAGGDAGDAGAAAAAAAATAGDNGSGGVGWLPGIDTDSAKFVTDLGYKDLSSFVKGAIETKRAFSARAFEVPKAEDADSWNKIAAAQGVPESADKYDFGEPGKAMKPEEMKAWAGELHKLGIPQKAAQGLVGVVAAKAAAYQAAQDDAFVQASDAGFAKVKLEWGDNFDKNYDLAGRGMRALSQKLDGITADQIKGMEKAIGTRGVHMLGLIFGQHTVEAGFAFSDGQHRGMTKESAAARLKQMELDPKIAKALVSRTDPDHQKYLQEKVELGKIAHG